MDTSQSKRSADPVRHVGLGGLRAQRLLVSTELDIFSGEPLGSRLRSLAATALLVAGAVHIPPAPEHLHEAPYIGVLFIALAVACAVLAPVLAHRDRPVIWTVATLLAVAAALAYVVSRTIGLPQIHDDIGNWSDLFGAVALTTETAAAGIGTYVLGCHFRHRKLQPPVDTGDRSVAGKDPHR
jgi:hypothetical protein